MDIQIFVGHILQTTLLVFHFMIQSLHWSEMHDYQTLPRVDYINLPVTDVPTLDTYITV